MNALRRHAPALFGLVLVALFFAPTLDPRVQLYYRDTGRLYYPVKLFIAEQLRAGHLPFWDPLTECGISLLGQVTLARRLGASPWARLSAAIAYAGCGYVVSVTGSNLPYSVGAGSVPIAVDAVL